MIRHTDIQMASHCNNTEAEVMLKLSKRFAKHFKKDVLNKCCKQDVVMRKIQRYCKCLVTKMFESMQEFATHNIATNIR